MRSFLLDLIRRATGTAQLAESLRALRARFENPDFDDKKIGSDRDAILHRINYVKYLHLREATRLRELYYRDLMLAIDKMAGVYPQAVMSFEARQPVAADTDDHRDSVGLEQDNTRLPRFVAACERHFGRPLTLMDVQPRAWWEQRFAALGMKMRDDHGFLFEDFCRGTGNGTVDENYREHPEVGSISSPAAPDAPAPCEQNLILTVKL